MTGFILPHDNNKYFMCMDFNEVLEYHYFLFYHGFITQEFQ